MKLLFDQNLSYKLVKRLAELFPGSDHIRHCNLQEALDNQVWQYAFDNGYTIVTQDSDFYDLALVNGIPPKIIWVRAGNTSTQHIFELMTNHSRDIQEFIKHSQEYCLELY